MLILYSILYSAMFIVLSPLFILNREKYASGVSQRLGNVPETDPEKGPVVWIHCVSVGETNAARKLVEGIKESHPEFQIVVSTTTLTGQNLARKIFEGVAAKIIYIPFVWRFSVRRALRRINPRLVLIIETEIWPNFIRESKKFGAKVFLVNGRLSEKSLSRYALVKGTIKRILNYFELALMQGAEDARRLIKLGIRSHKVKTTGNIKFDQDETAEQRSITREVAERFGLGSGRSPLVIAASTHNPEELILLRAFREVWNNTSEELPRLMIAPRHPERFDEVGATIKKTGFDWVRRSEPPSGRDRAAEIILLDSIGELRHLYGLADAVFVGGSLIPHGGQSILEPAASKTAIITGSHTHNFEAAVERFLKADAIVQLPDLPENELVLQLSGTLQHLLTNTEFRDSLAENAYRETQQAKGGTANTLAYLAPYFKEKSR